MPDASPPSPATESVATDARAAAVMAALPAGSLDPAAFRYEPEYEALEARIRTAEREGPTAADWPAILRESHAILAGRSRDLLVAAWFAHAATRIEGLGGLRSGLLLLLALVETQWEALFPPLARARARIQALDWLAARTTPLVADIQAAEGAPEALAAAEMLQAGLDAKLGPNQASLGELIRALRPLAERVAAAEKTAKEKALQPPAPPATTPPGAPATSQAAAVAAGAIAGATVGAIAVALDGSPAATFNAVREGVRSAALALLQSHPREARGYALLSAVTWLHIDEAPPATLGRTQLLPPPQTRLDEFAALRKAGNLAELVLSVLRYTSGSGMFWLDGQRLAHQALLEQGPGCAAAAGELAQGAQQALARLPGLMGLAFQDGTAFADAQTRGWLEGLAAPAMKPDASKDTPAWTVGLAEAREMVGRGEAKAGALMLAQGLRAANSGRARFHWQAALARYCLELGHGALALPLAQQAMEQARDALGWEPEAAADAAALLRRCLAMPGAAPGLAGEALASRQAAAWNELARLDPAGAVNEFILA